MAKKFKKQKKLVGENRHHLLFQRRFWEQDPYARFMRNHFIFLIDINVHNGLHKIVHDVPIPPRKMLVSAVQDYNENQAEVANYNILQAIDWLMAEMPYRPFTDEMQKQYNYFKEKRLGR